MNNLFLFIIIFLYFFNLFKSQFFFNYQDFFIVCLPKKYRNLIKLMFNVLIKLIESLFKLVLSLNFFRKPVESPKEILGKSPDTSLLEVSGISFLLNSFIESIFECDNTSSDEQVSEEDYEWHRPNDCKPIIVSHKTHRILLTHHCDDLHFDSVNERAILLKIGADEAGRQEWKPDLDG